MALLPVVTSVLVGEGGGGTFVCTGTAPAPHGVEPAFLYY